MRVMTEPREEFGDLIPRADGSRWILTELHRLYPEVAFALQQTMDSF
jgi:hypothetical protein